MFANKMAALKKAWFSPVYNVILFYFHSKREQYWTHFFWSIHALKAYRVGAYWHKPDWIKMVAAEDCFSTILDLIMLAFLRETGALISIQLFRNLKKITFWETIFFIEMAMG